MIPADHITFNDDGTAWLVFKFGTGLNGKAWEELDRPCDTCGGETAERHGEDYLTHPCSDCINGRHTFEIDVEQTCPGGGELCGEVGPHPLAVTCPVRVSIVPGMVLPIWPASHADGVHGPHICIQPGPTFTLHTWDGWQRITLPPAAAPGMFAVQLRVTT